MQRTVIAINFEMKIKGTNNFDFSNIPNWMTKKNIFSSIKLVWCLHCTLLQGGCKSKNQCLQILIRYTFPCSKWRITLEKVQNWSLYSFKSAYWKDTFLSFTSKIWSELRKSIILVFMQKCHWSHLLKKLANTFSLLKF